MPPFTIEFFCPRSGNPNWQAYREGLIFKTVRVFMDFNEARMLCDSLVWQYHSAHVLDASGRVIYQI